MSKKPTPKKKLSRDRSKRRYKTFQNKAREKLMGMVTFMKKLQKNPSYQEIQSEDDKKSTQKITKVKA